MVTDADVLKLAKIHFPEKKVQNITDLGIWLRHTFKVQFEDSPSVFYKFHVNPELNDGSVHEYRVTEILKYAGLPAAEILVVDKSRRLIDDTFIVVAEGPGERLDRIIKTIRLTPYRQPTTPWGLFTEKCTKSAPKNPVSGRMIPEKSLILHPMTSCLKTKLSRGVL